MAKIAKRPKGLKEHKLKVENVPVERLKIWERNPRRNDAAAEKLVGVIEEHGFISPIVATRDGIIRAGNTRYKAAMKLGMSTVPVLFIDFGSEAEAELYSISDNKSSEWAEWDEGLLKAIVQDAPRKLTQGHGIERLTGFTERELDGLKVASVDYSAKSFADVATEFEQSAGATEKPQAWWLWVEFDDEDEYNEVREALGKGQRGGREVDSGSLLVALGLRKTPPKRTKERVNVHKIARKIGTDVGPKKKAKKR